MKLAKRLEVVLFQRLRALRLGLSRATFRNRIEIDRAPSAASAASDLVVFTSADGPYLQRFMRSFVRSVVEHVADARVHVHLFNPSSEDYALLAAVERAYPTLQLSFSHETFSSEAHEQRARSSPKQPWRSLYICCARFLAARTIQQGCNSPLLMLDIDVLINGDVRSRFGGDVGVSLLLRPDEPYLSKRTLGGVVFASTTPEARTFLATACDYIERYLGAGIYWFAFDQYALYKGVQSMSPEARAARFSPLTSRDIDFDLSGHGLILYPKGALKHGEAFAQIAASGRDDNEAPQWRT